MVLHYYCQLLVFAGQVHNTSNDSPVAVRDVYFPVKDSDVTRVQTQHLAGSLNPSGLNTQFQKQAPAASIQLNASVPGIQTALQNSTMLDGTSAPQETSVEQPAAVVSVDPKRKPVIHATTPLPINLSPASDSKQKPDLEALPTSSINVTSDNKVKMPVFPVMLSPGLMSLHTTLIPHGYGRIPMPSQMAFQHPMLPYSMVSLLRRPVPHRPSSYMYTPSASNQHSYIIKKPYYRPAPVRPMSIPSQFHRPMSKTRIPLQQSPTSLKATYHFTQPLKLQKVSTSTTTPLPDPPKTEPDGTAAIKPSPPILPSDITVLDSEDSHIPAAVNTGFNPHSVVVEGGFKPIIKSKSAEAEDRSTAEAEEITEKPDAGTNKTEEVIVELGSEVVVNIADEERKDNPFRGQQPEMFEPIFVPSPPDRNSARNGSDVKNPILADELTPPAVHLNHRYSPQSNRKNGQPFMMIHPRPGLMRRPLFPNNIVPPFRIPVRGGSPTFRYQQSDDYTEDETPMAAERMDSYLPPADISIPSGVAVTYDGKSVASSIPPAPVAVKNIRGPLGTADLIRATPQFAPFQGEIPPPVPNVISPEKIPQLSKENQQQAQTLPEQFKQQGDAFLHPPPIERTQLVLVQQDSEELESESSEIKEIMAANKGNKPKKQAVKKAASSKDEGEIMSTVDDRWPFSTNKENKQQTDESTVITVEPEGSRFQQMADGSTKSKQVEQRERRSAHHEPGHVGYDDQQHLVHSNSSHQQSDQNHTSHQESVHNHSDYHDHAQHKQSRATFVTFSSVLLLFSPFITKYL